jgi:acetyl esterase/lipase
MTTSLPSFPAMDAQGNMISAWARSLSPRRTGILVLLLTLLLTISNYLLQAKLNYPAILLDKASLARTLVAQGEMVVLLGFVGFLLSGGLLVVISLGLVPNLEGKRRRRVIGTGCTSGVLWVVGALLGLVLVPLWGSVPTDVAQITATLILVTVEIATPFSLVFWTLTLARQFQAHNVLGTVGAIGLLLTIGRSLLWGLNAFLPIESGFYATAGMLNVLSLVGESFWVLWLLLFGFHLLAHYNLGGSQTPQTHETHAGQAFKQRRRFLKVGVSLGVVLAGGAFVLARTGLTIASQPDLEGDDIPSEPSFIGTLVYLIALVNLKIINPVHTIAQQLAMPQSKTPLPPGVSLEHVVAGGVPAQLIVAPGSSKSRWILYLHGGGFAQAGTDDNRAFAARLSQATSASALYPDYRLAPEHPFPAGLNDCVTAYRWLRSQGVAASHIALAGESAGGNLVLTTALALRESGDELPAALVAISPATDLAMTSETYQTKAVVDPILGSGLPQDAFALYTNHGTTDPRMPLVSPLYANLQGLSPTLLQVGTQEVLLNDSTRLALRLQAAGVAVQLEVWPGMFHAFSAGPDFIPEARLATQHIVKFILQHLGR